MRELDENTVEDVLDVMLETLEFTKATQHVYAQLAMVELTAYLDEGFTREEAMSLLLADRGTRHASK